MHNQSLHSPSNLLDIIFVFIVTFGSLALFAPRIMASLDPVTGDEPFYLMTALSLLKDGDLNECNNFLEHQELTFYPSQYSINKEGYGEIYDSEKWRGWTTAPLPLPPHPALISPKMRQCSSNYNSYPVIYDNPQGELYSKHGLGLSLITALPFHFGGRQAVALFLNIIAAFLAVNIYLIVYSLTQKRDIAFMSWLAFSFTTPLFFYSYLIFPELPAALLILYVFRRIYIGNNNILKSVLIGSSIAFLPWLHFRFLPICLGLVLYYICKLLKCSGSVQLRKLDLIILILLLSSSIGLLGFLYQFRYGYPWPNFAEHSGMSDLVGTLRGMIGYFYDEQWGLFPAAPIFILAIVGVILMLLSDVWNLFWIVVVALPYFIAVSGYSQWWGEWCPPGRYIAPILPLLSIPFAISFKKISGFVYRGVYWLLLSVSLLITGLFIFDPHWLYNSPIIDQHINDRSEIFSHAPIVLANSLNMPILSKMELSGYFPSYVSIYFASLTSSDWEHRFAEQAYVESIIPLLATSVLVMLCLLLAFRKDMSRN